MNSRIPSKPHLNVYSANPWPIVAGTILRRFTGVLILFCAIANEAICAQDQKATPQPSAGTPMMEQKSSAPSPSPTAPVVSTTATTTVPLTIEQIRTNLPLTPAAQFEFLRRQRKITLEAIDEASTQLKALATSMTLLQKQQDVLTQQDEDAGLGISREDLEKEKKHATEDLARARQALQTATTKSGTPKEQIDRLQEDVRKREDMVDKIEGYFGRVEQEEKRKSDREAAGARVSDELARQSTSRDKITQLQLNHQRLLGEVDDMVNQLFISSDATNSFKLKMSIAFAGLVAVVIAGFFWIAFSNEDVKKAIFSNEAGIQFITMFSIVIAVILFGIIGILESKELSALLGGLSGYILGKTRGAQTP